MLFSCILTLVGLTAVSAIQGGQNSTGLTPWTVSVQYRQSQTWAHNCGGALLFNQWVITATRCLVGVSTDPARWRAMAGAIDMVTEDPLLPWQTSGVEKIFVQEGYNDLTQEQGLTLLKLVNSFDTDATNVDTIGLPDSDTTDFTGSSCLLSGWGQLTYHGTAVPYDVQQETSGVAIPTSTCNSEALWNGLIVNEGVFMCSGKVVSPDQPPFPSGCGQFDHGNPLVCEDNVDRLFDLAGISVWHDDLVCGELNPPVYTRVATHREWILETIFLN